MTKTEPLQIARRIACFFTPTSGPVGIAPLGRGLINDSFLVTAGAERWVLQRINGSVFADPEGIMANLSRLAEHLTRQAAGDLVWPELATTAEGLTWVRDEAGLLWRMMGFIPGQPLVRINGDSQATEVGRLLGAFHRGMADLDPASLRLTLPGFHVTPGYLERFDGALRGGVPAPDVGLDEALALVESRRAGAGILEEARAAGLIPDRVVHGDPKLDNLLFDVWGRRALAWIDLDTVQPGLTLHDIADCLRSCCNTRGESASRVSVGFDLGLCRALLGAYAHRTRGLLRPMEVEVLYPAIWLLPFELGLRFLTDHLQGDRWFRVSAPGQNLVRAGVQFALMAAIERLEGEIRVIINDCFRRSWADSR
jgi:Ser/Thr protein kinase RdoA (MazF antagonist)